MEFIVESFRPYHESSIWRLHDSYYATSGALAWTSGEVPYVATSSYSMARQHARTLVGLVEELTAGGMLGPSEEVWVLEVGGGLGSFASHLLAALGADCGRSGVRLRDRLRFVLSDYSRKSVADAIAVGPLVEATASGLVIPALLDLARPLDIRRLDGGAVSRPFTAVFANYVCCALPPRIIRKTRAGFDEKLVCIGVKAEEDDDLVAAERRWREVLAAPARPKGAGALSLAFGWRRTDLAQALGDPLHERVFRDLVDPFDEATVTYPQIFLDFARAASARMITGAVLFVSDYGSARAIDLRGLGQAPVTRYGGSVAHGVNFALFEAFCRHAGLSLLRTRDPLLSVHRAAIRYGRPVTPELAAAFRRGHVRDGRGQVLIDIRLSAAALAKAGDHKTAVRLYRRGLRFDPDSAELYFRLGESCSKAGLDTLAIRYLLRGRRLDLRKQYAFDFALGRCYLRLGRLESARRTLRRALRSGASPRIWLELGRVHERLGDPRRARLCYRRTLALAPKEEELSLAACRRLAALPSAGGRGQGGAGRSRQPPRPTHTREPSGA